MKNKKGFTLLELLIVITILAVLSVAVIVIINPAETIKKARDTQRISDLSSIKTAISLYQSLVTTPYLGGSTSDTACKASNAWDLANDLIWYSLPADAENITDTTLAGAGTFTSAGNSQVATTAEVGEVDGTGWLPVDLLDISTGSPISNFPVDPTNDVSVTATSNLGGTDSSAGAVNANALVYRYACDVTSSVKTYEINATLESSAFNTTPTATEGAENKDSKDGGNSDLMYEVGTKLDILPANDTSGTAGF